MLPHGSKGPRLSSYPICSLEVLESMNTVGLESGLSNSSRWIFLAEQPGLGAKHSSSVPLITYATPLQREGSE